MDQASSSKTTLAAFPNEVFEAIFDYLSPVELSSLSQASRSLCQMATSSMLWERAYFSFWREGDRQREAKRGTTDWRQRRRFADLKDCAKRAWLLDGKVSDTVTNYTKRRKRDGNAAVMLRDTPFPLYLSSSLTSSATTIPQSPHFYRLFLERIQIDQEVLRVVNMQCCSSNRWMERVKEVVDKYGNDAKDVLHALVTCQMRKGAEYLINDDEGDFPSQQAVFPTALQVRLPSTNRSPTHHLTLLHYGRELLEHLQIREALHGFLSLRPGYTVGSLSSHWIDAQRQNQEKEDDQGGLEAAKSAKQFEAAISWLSMFRGGEGQEIAEELDMLAVSCSLYLASQAISLDSDTRQLAAGIYAFMLSRSFKGATPADYENLDNNFIHLCLDESGRETLPLSLAVLYSAIAARLGLTALPTNTPARVLIVVEPRLSSPLSSKPADDRFWIDVYADGQILETDDVRAMLARMRFPMQGDLVGPGTAASTCLRSSRNIIRSVQSSQGAPRFDPQDGGVEADMDMDKASISAVAPQEAANLFEQWIMSTDSLYNPRRTYLDCGQVYLVSPFWQASSSARIGKSGGRYRRMNKWSYFDQQAAMHAASNALTRLGDDLGDRGSDWCASLVQTYFHLDTLIMQDEFTMAAFHSPLYVRDDRSRTSLLTMFQTLIDDDCNGPTPMYRTWPDHSSIHKVGTLFVHRAYGYKAAIIGWNDHCSAPESWILNMGVDNLPNGGRRQPFYQSVHEDGSTRYVAHCNVVPALLDTESRRRQGHTNVNRGVSVADVEEVLQQRGIGKLFRCLSRQGDTLRLVKTEQGIQAFPDD